MGYGSDDVGLRPHAQSANARHNSATQRRRTTRNVTTASAHPDLTGSAAAAWNSACRWSISGLEFCKMKAAEDLQVPVRGAEVWPLSVEAYHTLGEAGLIPERTELLYGFVYH